MAIKRSSNPDQKSTKTKKTFKQSQHSSQHSEDDELLIATAMFDEIDNNETEEKIRPHRLADYIGQKDLKSVLEISIAAAKARKETLDHLLLYGPPGLGKTTMSLILASEMGVNCKITAAPALERPRDITGLLINLKPGDVLFIDEIHRLKSNC